MPNSTIGQVQIILSAQSNLLSKGFADATKAIHSFQKSVVSVAAAWVSISALKQGAQLVDSTMASVMALRAQEQQLGVTAQALAGLNLATARAGIDQEKFAAASGILQKNIAGLAVEAPQAVKAFDNIGMTLKDIAGRSFDVQLGLIADALNRQKDSSARAAQGMLLFGEQYRALIPMLAGGSRGLDAQATAANELGQAITDIDIDKVMATAQAFSETGYQAKLAGQKMLVELTPRLDEIAVSANDVAAAFGGWAQAGTSAGKIISKALIAIHEGAASVFQGLVDLADEFVTDMSAVGKAIEDIWNAIAITSRVPVDAIILGWKTIKVGVLEVVNSLSDIIVDWLRNTGSAFGLVSSSIEQSFTDAANAFSASTVEAFTTAQKESAAASAAMKRDAEAVGDAWSKVGRRSGEHMEFLTDLSSAAGAAVQEFDDQAAQIDVVTVSAIARAGKAALKSVQDTAVKVGEVVRDAAQVAEFTKNRAALVDSAGGDPRVRYSQEVADNMRDVFQNYSTDEAKEEADNRAEQMAFYADPASDPGLVYQERVAELVARVQHQAARDELELQQQRIAAQRQAVADSLGSVATLASAFGAQSKVLFEVGKVAAIAQAEMNAWITFSATLANASKMGIPLPLAEVEAALGFAAAQVAVTQIAAQSAPGRANGGPVAAGSTYLVGERGPELLTMGGNGNVTPNSRIGGGPAKIVVNLHNAPAGTSAQVSQTQSSDGTLNVNVMFDQLSRAVAGDIRAGGPIAKAMEGTYGMNRSRGAK
ncbi:MAG: hypothetical protein H0X38_05630 [Planctomycetes bacterium]|nr:hypothetical protein [Planctomycetota bacterium]